MNEKKPPLYLLDSYGLIYRSYFAFLSHPLRNSENQNVSALFGFARNLVALLNSGAPTIDSQGGPCPTETPLRLAAIFDSRTPTFRHKMYGEYKANREKAPDDLHAQVPLVSKFLAALGVPSLQAEGYEADDIIATLVEKCKAEGRQCYILSSDKDLLQLVGGGTFALRPSKSAKTEPASFGWDLIGQAEVKTEWGVNPEKILDLLSLSGDSSDNIPGVLGIGEKTAAKLMARYGSLDEIYKNIAAIEGAVGKRLAEGKESAYFSQSLVRLETKVPLPISGIDELSVENLNRPAGAQVLWREGVRQVAKMLYPQADGKNSGDANAVQAEMAPSGVPNGEAPSGVPTGAPNGDSPSSVPNDNTNGESYNGEAHKHALELKNEPLAQAELLGQGAYQIVLDIDTLESILAEAKKQKLLAIDFETDSLDAWNSRPIGFSLALKPKEAFYVPLAPHDKNSETPSPFVDTQKVRALLSPFFADKTMTIAAHNAKYDYQVSRGWGIDRWQCAIWDTMVAAWVSDPERNNYSLDSLASYFFDYAPIAYKDIVPKGETFDVVPLETAARYSAEDADLCLRLMRHLEPRLKEAGALELFANLEMPLLPILAEMEGAGIKIEADVLKNYGRELSTNLDSIQAETWKLVGHEFNLASTKQLQEVLFTERKLKPGKKTKTGFSTDAAALEELAHEDPVPALILRHRTLAKLKSTYVDTLAEMADSEGRIHTNFVQTGTATGRLSSSEPNLQNIPIRAEEGRRIREAFVAKPGCLLISADYSQIELVVLAHLSQDKNLVAAFKEGKDVHARTAALIFGIDESEVKGEQRRIAKTINFGVIYGMSAFRLANELGISRTDAGKFIEAYFRTYSGVSAFIEKLIQDTESSGFVTTIFGRRRYVPTINSRNKTEKAAAERVAVNTPIQGSAADIVKTAMLNLDKSLSAKKCPARLLLQVHDELILECPAHAAESAIKLIKAEMENAVTLSVPLHVSVETGNRWGDFH